MNLNNMMKLVEQQAKEQQQALGFQKNLQTQRLLIMTTMINDGLNIDNAVEKVIKLLIAKGIKGNDLEIITALVNLAKSEVKGMLENAKKLMDDIK